MKGKIQKIFTSEKVLLASRIILGSIFIAASVSKLSHTDEFVTLVASYNILPYGLAAVYGYLVPWLELLIGLFLILGLFVRFVSALSIPLIISFIIASSYELLTGAGGSCGCFGDVMPLTLPQSLNLDALMLLLTIPLIIHRTNLLSVQQWLAGPEHYHLKTGGFAFSGAGKILSIIAVITLLLSSSPQTVQATTTSDQNMAASQPVSENTIVFNEEIQEPAGVKNVIKDPSTNTVQNVSLDARINTALDTKEAVFLFFYTDWCGYCKKQKPVLDVLEPEFSGDITFIRVNADENRQAMQQFGVTGFPTMFLITDTDSSGSFVQQKFTGLTDESKLRAGFSQAISGGEYGQGVKNTIKPPATDTAQNVTLDARINTALETKEAAFLYFYADWCGFCQKQKPIIDTLEQQYSGQILFLRLNNEKEAEALTQFGITGFPTMYLITDMSETGDFISQRFVGYTDEVKLKTSFDRIISGDGSPSQGIVFAPIALPASNLAPVRLTSDGGGPSQRAVSAAIAPPANDPAPVLNGGSGEITCFGTPSESIDVCGGKGQCVAQDTCECEPGYSGEWCQTVDPVTCNEVASDSPDVCGGNGQCVAQDVCVCDDFWSGQFCSDAVMCNTVPFNSPSVCSGNGACNANGTCTCNQDWGGVDCDIYTGVMCFGLLPDDPAACSGHGDCENDGTCTCNEYWTGDECETEIICNGVPRSAERVCGGHGTCEDTMTCTCDSPYTGINCEELPPEPIYCFGIVSSNLLEVCSGQGTCVATDTCECNDGFIGENCEDEALFYISIDIKPGSDPNSINLGSNGVIPVAILTEGGFDTASVNTTSIRFGRTGDEAEPVHHAFEDVDDDGDMDIIFHFRTQETGLEAEDTEAILTGQTIDGIEITGTDSIRIVPPKGKGKKNKSSKPEKGGGQDNGNDNPNSGPGNNQGGGNDNPNSGPGNNQGGGNDNPNSGPGNNQGGENGNSNPGQGSEQGNQNGNPNPGQGNNQGGGNDNPNSGPGNNQGGENDNPNPGQGNGKGKGKK